MLTLRACGALLTVGLGLSLASPAAAQNRPTIAIMPTQYFSADAQSAENVSQGLVAQFEQRNYRVLPMDEARETFQAMGLRLTYEHYPDRTALAFGRRMGADLVAYPRLLAVGIPINAPDIQAIPATAVLHLRVLNVHTGETLYFRQVGHEFRVAPEVAIAGFILPQPVATATADDVTDMYFEMVAGSREEFRRTRTMRGRR